LDYQILFNGAVIVASFFGGWTLNTITRSLERLDNDVRNMPHSYVNKDDYRNDIKEVKDMLGKIFDKLDTKVDK
jgi:predicted RNA-binding protein with EMAP domain